LLTHLSVRNEEPPPGGCRNLQLQLPIPHRQAQPQSVRKHAVTNITSSADFPPLNMGTQIDKFRHTHKIAEHLEQISPSPLIPVWALGVQVQFTIHLRTGYHALTTKRTYFNAVFLLLNPMFLNLPWIF